MNFLAERQEEQENTVEFYKKFTDGSYTYDATEMGQILRKDVKEELVEPFRLKENEILIGFSSIKYIIENAVIITLNLTSAISLLVIGIRRTGKSATSARIVGQIHKKQKIPIIAVDSSGELFTHRYPFGYYESDERQERLREWFEQFGEEPKGLYTYVISPKALGESENVDKQYAISYGDIKRLHKYRPQDAKTIVAEILGVTDNKSNVRLISLAMEDERVPSWEGFKNKLISLRKGIKTGDEEADKLTKSRATNVFIAIEDAISSGWISDDPNDWVDVLELAKKYELLVWAGQIRTVKDDNEETVKYNGILKLFLTTITEDVIRFQKGANDCYLTNPNGIILWMPEVDSLVNAEGNSSLKPLVSQIVTKMGKHHINSVFDVQNAANIDDSIFKNSVIMSSKADNDNYLVLKERGIGENALSVFKRLITKIKVSIGITVSQFGFSSESIDPVFFFPAPPTSQVFEERFRNVAKEEDVVEKSLKAIA